MSIASENRNEPSSKIYVTPRRLSCQVPGKAGIGRGAGGGEASVVAAPTPAGQLDGQGFWSGRARWGWGSCLQVPMFTQGELEGPGC